MSTYSDIVVRRSRRRHRTVSAYREGGTTVVLLPASFSQDQEEEWVRRMLRRLDAREERRRPDDAALQGRAEGLAERYLDARFRPTSVRWVRNQNSRWGSCTPADGTIRLSRRLEGMPEWVIDYVLLHELVHLVIPGHGPDFWALVNRFPKTERARGYLEGVQEAPRLHATYTRVDADHDPRE